MKQTAGKDRLGDLAPNFAYFNDEVLFGKVWENSNLAIKERCIVTVTALISKGIFDNSLKYHIENAKNHGVSKDEMVQIVTHLAFYVGWSNAWAAFAYVKEVYQNEASTFSPLFGLGKENSDFSKYFIGKSYLNSLNLIGVKAFNVTFEPKCRNNYHIHHYGGQILLCVDGKGYYKEEGKEVRKLNPGDVVYIAPGIKHFHGAQKDSYFSHIAIEIPHEKAYTEWLESVDDETYFKLL